MTSNTDRRNEDRSAASSPGPGEMLFVDDTAVVVGTSEGTDVTAALLTVRAA